MSSYTKTVAVLFLLGLFATCAAWRPEGADPYELLGLRRSGGELDAATLKKAYRQSALRWHPDKVPEDQRAEAEQKFIAIAWAYEVLSDPARRREFDQPPSPSPRQQHSDSGSQGDFSSQREGSFGMKDAASVFKKVFGEQSEDYHDLVQHLAHASRVGDKEHWQRHAEAVAQALKKQRESGETVKVRTQSQDGMQKTETSRSFSKKTMSDGSTVKKETMTTKHTQTEPGLGSLGHDRIPDAHAAALAAHHAAHAKIMADHHDHDSLHKAMLAQAGMLHDKPDADDMHAQVRRAAAHAAELAASLTHDTEL
eukprot:TRINITY_DN19697_c0_g1_i1.p1 TRINITY_DN19697_c0_g1~~TRINITY_DN19697_c0_g1_i1.p1  ORF type:complete len:311 (+),score=51.09 TRINITY_DN19697_c0_g1_i1:182-1114(+)